MGGGSFAHGTFPIDNFSGQNRSAQTQFWISGSPPHSRRPREVTVRVACFFYSPIPQLSLPLQGRNWCKQKRQQAGRPGQARPGQGQRVWPAGERQKRSMRASPASPLLSYSPSPPPGLTSRGRPQEAPPLSRPSRQVSEDPTSGWATPQKG